MADDKQYKIVNAYDDVVRHTVREVMSQMDMCQCEKCFLDACAMVFNNGYTKFVTTERGEILANIIDMKQSRQVQLKMDAVAALKKIKEHPSHE